MDKESENGPLEQFRIEFRDVWHRLPNKTLFFTLLAVWMALFQFLGNSTLGYINSPSIIQWTLNAYNPNGEYMESEDGHGVLVPFVVLALFWWKRRELLAGEIAAWWPGLLIVGVALFFHLLGFLIQQPRISLVAMFLGIYGLMGLAWGPGFLRRSFFPFLLFGFCIPWGALMQPVSFGLRLLVCQLVELVSHYIVQIDIVRQGTGLFDPTGQFQYDVAAACSGVRSLTATLALATVFAFVSLRSWWRRAILIASAFPLAVIGNLLRMMAIVIAADIWGQDAGNYVHEGGPLGIFSLMPYVPAFIGLMLLENWLYERPPAGKSHTPVPGAGGPGAESLLATNRPAA
jgi:exosortase